MTLAHDRDRTLRFAGPVAEVHETTARELDRGRRVIMFDAARLSLAKVNLLLDVLAPAGLLRVQTIVGMTADAQVVDGVRAAESARHHVIELEKRPARAARPVRGLERALLTIAFEHRTPHLLRDPVFATRALPRTLRLSEARLLELGDEQTERTFCATPRSPFGFEWCIRSTARSIRSRPAVETVNCTTCRPSERGATRWAAGDLGRAGTGASSNERVSLGVPGVESARISDGTSGLGARDAVFDLPRRLSGRLADHVADVLVREHVAEQDHRREVHVSACDGVEDDRKSTNEARCGDPARTNARAHRAIRRSSTRSRT